MPKSGVQIQVDHIGGSGPKAIDADELKALLQSEQRSKTKIVDLRTAEEFQKKHIAHSINIPFSDFQPEALAVELHSSSKESNGFSLIFVSLQSPDIDDFAAHQCGESYQQKYNGTPPSDSIRFLSGGFSNWISLFASDPSLVE